MGDQKEIRGLLKDQFAHFEAEPPRDLWQEIEADLYPIRRRRKMMITYMTVAASLLMLFALWWMWQTPARVENGGPLASEPEKIAPAQLAETDSLDSESGEPLPNIAPLLSQQDEPASKEPKSQETPAPEPTPDGDAFPVEPELEDLFAQEANENQTQEIAPESIDPIALNPMSPTDPRDVLLDHEALAESDLEAKTDAVTPAELRREEDMRQVSYNKLDLDDFSLENAISFASSEVSKWAKSPLDFDHKVGNEKEVKTYRFQLGDFSISRTSYKKIKK